MTKRYYPHLNSDKEKESPIGEYRVDKGLTINEFCAATGVKQVQYSAFQNGMESPINEKTGQIKEAAQKICDFLGISVEIAFPRYFCKIFKDGDGFTECQLKSILNFQTCNADTSTTAWQLNREVRRVLATLTPREEKVLRLRFGIDANDHTLEEVGDGFNVSRSMIRIIESRALRKLRHPSRSKKLEDFL